MLKLVFMKRIVFGMLLLPVAGNVFSQQTFNNTGNLKIYSGGSLAAHGNFVNAASANLVNDGNLYVKRNLTSSQPGMSSGTGTLYLDGSTAQTMDGSQPFKTYNLVTGNTAGILINQNLRVGGLHTFNSGVITTASTPNYLVYEAGSSYSGNGDNKHVNGWVQKVGTTDFTFPVGNGTLQRPVTINNLSGSSVFIVKYNATTPNTNQLQSPIVSIDANEYWDINEVSGGIASVTLNWDHSKVAFPVWNVADIRAVEYNGSKWVAQGGTAAGTVTTTGTITSNSLSSFGRITFGSVSTVLPLTLLSFGAKRDNEKTELSWKTTNEVQVSHFEVERSDNGVSFYSIGKVTARNTRYIENYNLSDTRSISNQAWYRLRSVDLDGAEKLSFIVRVSESSGAQMLAVSNPVMDKIMLTPKGGLTGEFDYILQDIDGKAVQRGKINLTGNTQAIVALSGSIPAGTYTLSLRKAALFITKKIIVTKS
jgi:hypothetical protein